MKSHILLVLASVATVLAVQTSTYIATVHSTHTAAQVATAIERRAGDALLSPSWFGTVQATHAKIRVVIVSGPGHTCAVLERIPGVKDCEADSIVMLYD